MFPTCLFWNLSPYFWIIRQYHQLDSSIKYNQLTYSTVIGDCSHEIKRCLLLGRKGICQPRWHIQKQRHYFANKGPSSQGYGFSSSHIWMWELDCEESWAPKNWCFWTVVLEKTLESPLDCKEIQPVHPKEISPGCSLEGLMLKPKLQYFGHLM